MPAFNVPAIIAVAAITIFELVCKCLAVKKSGNPWWSMLIPVYSYYVLYNLTKKPRLFWAYLPFHLFAYYLLFSRNTYMVLFPSVHVYLVGTLFCEFFGLVGNDPSGLLPRLVVTLVISIAGLIISAVLCKSLAKAYGKGTWFGIGLLLIPIVFWAILAFDSSIIYVGDDLPA